LARRRHGASTALELYGLRHTHASLLVVDGEPIDNVSHPIGHADRDITAHVFKHYVSGAQSAIATRFQSILKKANNERKKPGRPRSEALCRYFFWGRAGGPCQVPPDA